MNDTNLMKLMDLSAKLGKVLMVNPVWEDNHVTYRDEFDGKYALLSFSLDDGRWKIATDDYGVLYLPEKAPWLMAEMSELVKEIEVISNESTD